jgi:hypothetical protein
LITNITTITTTSPNTLSVYQVAASILLPLALIAVTAGLVWETRGLIKATNILSRTQVRPHFRFINSVFKADSNNTYTIEIQNIGKGAASNLLISAKILVKGEPFDNPVHSVTPSGPISMTENAEMPLRIFIHPVDLNEEFRIFLNFEDNNGYHYEETNDVKARYGRS